MVLDIKFFFVDKKIIKKKYIYLDFVQNIAGY